MPKSSLFKNIFSLIIPAMQVQISLSIAFLFTLIISLFYYFIDDPRFPKEKPEILFVGLLFSLGLSSLGFVLGKKYPEKVPHSLKQGAIVVLLTWFFACTISATVFILAGFPDPNNIENFSLFRRIVDGYYESMSGLTTAGTTILPSMEAFPRGLLMWRSLTHFLGGIGIAFMGIILLQRFFRGANPGDVVNGEVETPLIIEFENKNSVFQTGKDFLKIYLLLIGILIVLLTISGAFFRQTPYQNWYDNVYDAVGHSFSTIGTGGFSSYNTSAGLPVEENGQKIIGGLRNPVSEWIIAIFMFMAGANFALWYELFFKGNWKFIWKFMEFRVYFLFVFGITATIWLVLNTFDYNSGGVWDNLRYAFFNVNTVVSTTGLGNQDFTQWPAPAQGILFSCYIIGGMAGSTAGGLKMLRFMVAFKYAWMEIKNLILGQKKNSFVIDGIRYNGSNAGFILSTIMIYFLIFFVGGIALMVASPVITFADGTTRNIDFVSPFTASIANLTGIGPAVAVGSVNSGPTGNYYAYNEMGKIILIILMYVGRIGVLSFLMMFITSRGEKELDNENKLHVSDVDHDAFLLTP
jgi:trk system potassium uptake protein